MNNSIHDRNPRNLLGTIVRIFILITHIHIELKVKHHFENKNLLAVAAPDTKSGTSKYLLEVIVPLVSSAFGVATSRSITAGWSSATRSMITLVSRVVVAIRVVIFAVLHETDAIRNQVVGTLAITIHGERRTEAWHDALHQVGIRLLRFRQDEQNKQFDPFSHPW